MKAEVGFVQFHPSYDYTDFVEGLRPVNDIGSGQIGFERKDGVFKKFCERALENMIDSEKSKTELKGFLLSSLYFFASKFSIYSYNSEDIFIYSLSSFNVLGFMHSYKLFPVFTRDAR